MELLTADSFDVANVITNIGIAALVLLGVQVALFGWRKMLAFFR